LPVLVESPRGKGGGAADGGRDIEACFYTPDQDGELSPKRWWIECKGRKGTVDPDEVKSAVNNALAYTELDYLVLATNTQFSNPTRDWVKNWQDKYPRPKVQLWDRVQLERQLSQHPHIVLRLFANALSVQGRFHAIEHRFWNRGEYAEPSALSDLWSSRKELQINATGLFAVLASEFANGSVVHRPWAPRASFEVLLMALHLGLSNYLTFIIRSNMRGREQRPIVEALAYLILAALDIGSPEKLTPLLLYSAEQSVSLSDEAKEMILTPIANLLLAQIQDVCGSDCERMTIYERNVFTGGDEQIKDYWYRLNSVGLDEPDERLLIRQELHDAPCVVGFPVDRKHRCPLFAIRPTLKIRETIRIMDMVAIGRVVLTNREHLIGLAPLDKGLMGTLIRYHYEVRDEHEYFDEILDVKVTKDMFDLAKHIVNQKTADFEPEKFEDHYEEALTELINAKRNGRMIGPKPRPRADNVVNLMDALRQSISGEASSKGKKPQKAVAGQKEMLLPIEGKRRTEKKRPSPSEHPAGERLVKLLPGGSSFG
jgi:hypothetical protein